MIRVPEERQEVEGAGNSNVLDSVLGKVLEPAPGGVPPGPAVPEHQGVDHVPQAVEEGAASIHLSSVLALQILKSVDEAVEFEAS